MRRRTTLHIMLLRMFVPVLLTALAFFVSILQLVYLFDNITSYINNEISFVDILRIQSTHVPQSLHFALPMSLLFAVSFTLGTLYGRNELIAVFGAGVSLRGFVTPLVILGLAFSAGAFLFQENIVIANEVRKTALEAELLNSRRNVSSSNVTLLGSGSRRIYHADFYNDETATLSGALLIEREDDGAVQRIISARTVSWTGESWEAQAARVFERDGNGALVERFVSREPLPEFVLPPSAFRRDVESMDEMRLEEARAWIESKRDAGLPYRSDLAAYHERFSFSLTPFIVVLIATAIGGRFKKNILLMSLLVSLVVAVIYYVTQMVSGLLASSGTISPIMGAWAGVLLFVVIGTSLLRLSRT